MKLLTALLLTTLLSASASAEMAGDDPFARYLFPPDRVMAHSLDIGLEDAQKTAIKNEIQKVQGKFLDRQFELKTESEKMVRLLQEPSVDEARVLAQVDRILALEKDIKKSQVSLLVRIKNILTPAQQSKLAEMPR
ncbi:MAG: periplasmic heavy metal sensor [Acidobacteriota bacterium]